MVVMRRFLQSVALVLAVLLAVQLALASMTCAQNVYTARHSSADCCLPSSNRSMQNMSSDTATAMPSMSASELMSSLLALAGSNYRSESCCTVSVLTALYVVGCHSVRG